MQAAGYLTRILMVNTGSEEGPPERNTISRLLMDRMRYSLGAPTAVASVAPMKAVGAPSVNWATPPPGRWLKQVGSGERARRYADARRLGRSTGKCFGLGIVAEAAGRGKRVFVIGLAGR